MPSHLETTHSSEFILSEARGARSRENVIVLAGENLRAGHVLGGTLASPTVGAAAAFGTNTGNGTVSAPTAGNGVQRGTYKVVFVETVASLGTFSVFDPNGQVIGDGVVGSAFAGEVGFTISDGATDFVAGDGFTIAVTGGTYKVEEYDPADVSSGGRPYGVLLSNVDASAADKAGVAIVRQAEVREASLSWFAGATTAQKESAKRALEIAGLVVRA